ncbi:MAG: NTF2 fold immunity protein [Hyphomicrobium sp.]
MHEFEGREYDLPMYLYLMVGEKLITRATALVIAKMLLRDRFGAEEVDHQEPFHVEEQGDAWVIAGNGVPDWNDGPSYDPRIRSLGRTPDRPLPAFAIRVAYTRGPGARIEIIPLPADLL